MFLFAKYGNTTLIVTHIDKLNIRGQQTFTEKNPDNKCFWVCHCVENTGIDDL